MYMEENASYSRQDENDGGATLADWRRIGRPSMLSNELTTEIKIIFQNLRTAGCSISRKVVISVGNGVLQAKCPGGNGEKEENNT